MSYLRPELTWGPAHAVLNPVVLGDVAPAGTPALRAEQLFQPLIAEYKHRIGLENQARSLVAHTATLQLLWGEQVQEVFASVPFNALLRVSRATQVAPPGAPVAVGLAGRVGLQFQTLNYPLLSLKPM